MSRQCRRVPKDWQHPKDNCGQYIPMHERFEYTPEEIEEGLREGWLKGGPPYYDVPVMPQWHPSQRTHYQMYETTTEGTPISPVFDTPEGLARWLEKTGASAFADEGACYEDWLALIRQGTESVSFATNLHTGEILTGVAAAAAVAAPKERPQ